MLVPLVLMAMAAMARAFVVMMLMPTFTLLSLMIVPVGQLRPTTITVNPSWARRFATARPSPDVAPVTSAVNG